MTEWILLELMTGLRRDERPDTLVKTLGPVHRLAMQVRTWELAQQYAAASRRKGFSATAADCLIAAIAIGHQVPLLHCDADFER
jgi:predicted nucleic acid-binding protein